MIEKEIDRAQTLYYDTYFYCSLNSYFGALFQPRKGHVLPTWNGIVGSPIERRAYRCAKPQRGHFKRFAEACERAKGASAYCCYSCSSHFSLKIFHDFSETPLIIVGFHGIRRHPSELSMRSQLPNIGELSLCYSAGAVYKFVPDQSISIQKRL